MKVTYVMTTCHHDDIIKYKYFPRYWHFVRGIHRSPLNSPYKVPVTLALPHACHQCRQYFPPSPLLWRLPSSITLLTLWRLKSPASQLFTQSFIQTQIKENIKVPRHWPLCGEFTGTGEFPAQRASYAENVSIWWRHHDQGFEPRFPYISSSTCLFYHQVSDFYWCFLERPPTLVAAKGPSALTNWLNLICSINIGASSGGNATTAAFSFTLNRSRRTADRVILHK